MWWHHMLISGNKSVHVSDTGCADSFAYVLVPGKVERGTKLARLMQHSWSSADLETSQRHLHHLKHYLQVRLNLIITGFALIMHC